MRYEITLSDIYRFKEAAKLVCEDYGPNDEMIYVGLCNAIDRNGGGQSYEIMYSLLTYNEYNDGLGPSYDMTEDRWYFCKFISELSTEDLMEFVK